MTPEGKAPSTLILGINLLLCGQHHVSASVLPNQHNLSNNLIADWLDSTCYKCTETHRSNFRGVKSQVSPG
jgi:hypothetical protein